MFLQSVFLHTILSCRKFEHKIVDAHHRHVPKFLNWLSLQVMTEGITRYLLEK